MSVSFCPDYSRVPDHLRDATDSIEKMDLGPIKFKLIRAEDGEGWTADQATLAEKWYKRFLYLNLRYGKSHSIVPTKPIDQFWHYHILDTMKYAQDCQTIFGTFLHHFPYFGMRGEEDEKNLNTAFDQTVELFMKEFGESPSELRRLFPVQESTESSACEGTECGGTACGSTNCDGGEKCNPVFMERPSLEKVA